MEQPPHRTEYLRGERRNHTLRSTALVQEAYMRLVGHDPPTLHSRAHFCGIAACLMREILVHHACADWTALTPACQREGSGEGPED